MTRSTSSTGLVPEVAMTLMVDFHTLQRDVFAT
jgi:hypothetical protein